MPLCPSHCLTQCRRRAVRLRPRSLPHPFARDGRRPRLGRIPTHRYLRAHHRGVLARGEVPRWTGLRLGVDLCCVSEIGSEVQTVRQLRPFVPFTESTRVAPASSCSSCPSRLLAGPLCEERAGAGAPAGAGAARSLARSRITLCAPPRPRAPPRDIFLGSRFNPAGYELLYHLLHKHNPGCILYR
jgi:hypothetical protein